VAILWNLLRALADLVFPTRCAGCRQRGTSLCVACRWWLDRPAEPAVPTPCPEGMPRCFAVTAYAGPVRAVLLAYKERGRHRLGRPLAAALARSVLAGALDGRPLILVPVPSTKAAMRARGGDHLRPLAAQAARRLRAAGRPCEVRSLLVARPRPDSAGLSAAARAANRCGAFGLRPGVRRWLAAAVRSGCELVVVDDLVTTGATLAEICRVLSIAGAPPAYSAVVAATLKRSAHIRSP
jgi:predicted amidophosphoribosyltransferase